MRPCLPAFPVPAYLEAAYLHQLCIGDLLYPQEGGLAVLTTGIHCSWEAILQAAIIFKLHPQ